MKTEENATRYLAVTKENGDTSDDNDENKQKIHRC